MNVLVSELAFLIDDEKRAFRDAIVATIGAERFGHFTFGMEIAEKIIGNTAEALGPGCIAGNAVD